MTWVIEFRGVNPDFYYVLECESWMFDNENVIRVRGIIKLVEKSLELEVDDREIKASEVYIPVNNVTIIYKK